MPKIGVLQNLSEEQKEQLLTWIATIPKKGDIIDKIAAPPPEGFGIKTYITSLQRFIQRERIREFQEQLSIARAENLNDDDLALIRRAAMVAVTRFVHEVITAPTLHPAHVKIALKWLKDIEHIEIRKEQIELRRKNLGFQKEKLKMAAAFKKQESWCSDGHATIQEALQQLEKFG